MKKKPAASALGGVRRDVVSYVINRIAFADFEECCSANRVATALHKDPRRFRTVLRKLAAEGWITLSGTSQLRLYPTPRALRWTDPTLSESAARAIVRRVTGRR